MITRWHALSKEEFLEVLNQITPSASLKEYPPFELLMECKTRIEHLEEKYNVETYRNITD